RTAARDPARRRAPPIPCTARAETRNQRSGAAPAASDESAKSTIPARSSRAGAARAPSATRVKAPSASARLYAVTTQATEVIEASSPPRVAVIIVPVCVVAAAVFGLAISHGIDFLGGGALALLIAAVLAEAFPVPIEGVAAGATSFSDVFIAAAAVIYGWRVGAVVGALTMILVELYTRRPLLRLLFNSSIYVLAGAAAGT